MYGNEKGAETQPLLFVLVGMTRLELATSRPPDACANQLRYIPNKCCIISDAGAKLLIISGICKFLQVFFCIHGMTMI